jgi:integrase
MPIDPENYPDHSPHLTKQEKELMEQYLAFAPTKSMGSHVKPILAELQRFERPYWDTVRLSADTRENLAASRRFLFRAMLQTRKSFWAWPKETWVQVIQSVPKKERSTFGVSFRLANLAYVFCDFLYVGDSTFYARMADAFFGKTVVDAEVEKLSIARAELGFTTDPIEKQHFRWFCSLVMLVNRCPYIEAISAQTLMTVQDLLVLFKGRNASHRARLELRRLQTALCALGILDEPAVLVAAKVGASKYPDVFRDDPTIDPRWSAWICAFYEQTPHRNEKHRRQICYGLVVVGRWLKKVHPEVYEPCQWSEVLANEYVTYTCQAFCGDQMLPSHRGYAKYQKTPKPLSPHTMDHRLAMMRLFFSNLQRRTYLINNKSYPKLQLIWLPEQAFKTPDDIKAAAQPNPRDIQEDTWFKLIWAACTLTKEHLYADNRYRYSLAYYRAACLIWVTAARRADEIRRLSVGCVRREWAPEMCDEQGNQIEPEEELCYLRVPTNKYKGEFYVPIPTYVADAIEVWEQVRPPQQKAMIDRKTSKPTFYLFQTRNQLMSADFLNKYVIPLLCKLAGVSQTDVVGRITSHRARATTATWMHKMGMTPSDIGRMLGHTNPQRSLPWYLRENKHRLGRTFRKANPLDRVVAAILDTNAQAKGEPCVFYYLADGPDGRPRMCGNPHFNG